MSSCKRGIRFQATGLVFAEKLTAVEEQGVNISAGCF